MNENGELAFQPYTIPMGIHDVQIGVSLQMSISDIHTFATNYLTDRNSVTTRELQQLLNGTIEPCCARNSATRTTSLPD